MFPRVLYSVVLYVTYILLIELLWIQHRDYHHWRCPWRYAFSSTKKLGYYEYDCPNCTGAYDDSLHPAATENWIARWSSRIRWRIRGFPRWECQMHYLNEHAFRQFDVRLPAIRDWCNREFNKLKDLSFRELGDKLTCFVSAERQASLAWLGLTENRSTANECRCCRLKSYPT